MVKRKRERERRMVRRREGMVRRTGRRMVGMKMKILKGEHR